MGGRPQVWVLTGGNGAGKSTFYRLVLQPRGIALVNADVIAAAMAPDAPEEQSYAAAERAEALRAELLAEGVSFCFETVFSHPSEIDFVAAAKAAGYEVVLVYVHLRDESLHLARVSTRVGEGGHDVPPAKIISRLPRTRRNVTRAIPLADEVLVFDNSSATDPLLLVAHLEPGAVVTAPAPLPAWARALLGVGEG